MNAVHLPFPLVVRHRSAGMQARVMLILAACCGGCVTPGYEYGYEYATEQRANADLSFGPDEPQIERGRPVPLLDAAGWIVGIPSKVILLSTRVDDHHVSPETEAALQQYLEANGLRRVKVRLNQYAPLDEWKRLVRNPSVAPGWRYTLGTLAVAGYTVFPGRLVGGDHYNPFTNTISLYSDHPAIALHEAAHAKDFARRRFKGTWAAAYLLPVVGLKHEAIATSDTLTYLAETEQTGLQQAAYQILYPAYGSHVAGQINRFVDAPGSLAVGAACIIPGHLIGRWKAARLDRIRPAGCSESVTVEAASGAEPEFAAGSDRRDARQGRDGRSSGFPSTEK